MNNVKSDENGLILYEDIIQNLRFHYLAEEIGENEKE